MENGRLGFIETLHKQYWSLQHCLHAPAYTWAEFANSIFKFTTMDPMIPKEMKCNLHYGDVWGDFLPLPLVLTPAAV